jgi:YVTN family beta-propeller protein
MILDRRQIFLYVAEDNSDRVTVIDTRSNDVVGTVSTVGPARDIPEALLHYHGSAPNGLALSPDGTTLYVTNGGTNSVAVIKGLPDGARTIGLIPTGYDPYAVSVSADGRMLYVVNGKSPSGPNPGYLPVPNRCYFKSRNTNQFVEALQQSSLLSFSVPDGETLAQLSRVVAENNSFGSTPKRTDQRVLAALRQRVKHVIYVVKENRTYDQILGDLDRGNGDPRLTEFGEQITPNFHHLAGYSRVATSKHLHGDAEADDRSFRSSAAGLDLQRHSFCVFISHPVADSQTRRRAEGDSEANARSRLLGSKD